MTCTLRAPEFFDECPTSDKLADTGCFWRTAPFMTKNTWFTDCVAQGPMCE